MQEAVKDATSGLQHSLHAWKVAIELRDTRRLLEAFGISQHGTREIVLAAVRALHESFRRTAEQRRHILFDTLLFQRLPAERRPAFAAGLIELQQMFYLQRVIDMLEQ